MNDQTRFHAGDFDEISSNPSDHTQFSDILAAAQGLALNRRSFLKGGLGVGALGFLGGSASLLHSPEASAFTGPPLGFASVPLAGNDTVIVPPGYHVQILYAWGDPIGKAGLPAGTPAWSGNAAETAAEQEQQAGMHHDGMSLFPFPGNAGPSNSHALLAMNHEYVDQGLLFSDGMANWSLEKVRKSQAAHGVSIIEIRQQDAGWHVVRPSVYARRVTSNTPLAFSGPAVKVTGREGLGTLNNCAAGPTPWGTYLTCEENFNNYFGARAGDANGKPTNDPLFIPSDLEKRYGLNAAGGGYNWHHHDPRFDLNTTQGRAEANKFGWVVEIDPYNPKAMPVKRTALGRLKHEGATYAIAADGRVVIYMGDDQAGEYIYKFVSKHKYQAGNRTANFKLLDEGTLYVARFDAGKASGDNMGQGQWLELSMKVPVIAEHFSTLGDMLVNTRKAADLVGATKMDRPEWIAAHPKLAGQIYCTLTNNSSRSKADDANPRDNNRYGHIIRWDEAGGDTAALSFEWNIFVLAGDPSLPANAGTTQAGNIKGDTFGSPDGLWFDQTGRLWIQTDISTSSLGGGAYANMPNNMMLAANTVTGEIKRFLTGPRGCEITGITATPDGKHLFINIQHPGEGAGDASNPKDPAYPNKVSAWPSSQGYYGADLGNGDAKKRPRSATIAISRKDGGEIGF
jgi:secreted PhoX family phosphatase